MQQTRTHFDPKSVRSATHSTDLEKVEFNIYFFRKKVLAWTKTTESNNDDDNSRKNGEGNIVFVWKGTLSHSLTVSDIHTHAHTSNGK